MKQLSQEQISALPEWMPVEGFPNYEVNCREGIVRNAKTLRVLKPNLGNHGYPYIGLCKYKRRYTKNVHRLVANAAFSFYNIPIDGLLVMHLDEERNDPRISNLALGTQTENLSSPKAKQRISEAKRGEKNPNFNKHLSAEVKNKISDAQSKKAVAAYKNGILTLIFNNLYLVNVYGFNRGSVCNCCNGRLKTYKGYQWRYFDTTTAMTAS